MSQEAIPAATLVVVRDRAAGTPELLMVERADGMAFAAGALVFPGGRIDDSDRALAQRLGIKAAIVAAIRETLEETAVAVGLTPAPTPDLAAQLQERLVAGEQFAGLIDEHGLAIEGSAIRPFARWVPKFHAVRRFDTMFFVARAPAGNWTPRVIAGECSAARWITAPEALRLEQGGQARMIFPTRRNLERLGQHCDFNGIAADAAAHAIEPVTPWLEESGGTKFLTIPDHLGYPVTREAVEGQWRG